MIATIVFIEVKPDKIEDFKKITLYNHENSRKEAGNVRFDVLQIEHTTVRHAVLRTGDGIADVVDQDAEAAAEHKKTEHYAKWRAEVENYMAVPRHSVKTTPLAFD